MATFIRVEDPADPRLDEFRDLTHADRRPDRPGGRGLVVTEGVPVVQRLLASPYPVRAVFGVPNKVESLRAQLEPFDVPAYTGGADLMAAVVGFHLNRGVLATADRAPEPFLPDLLGPARRIAVLEGINDHENLGGLFRNAAGLGVDAILLGDRCADPLYRRSVRVSMGHVLQIPFTRLDPWPAMLGVLRHAGFAVLAMTPKPPAAALRGINAAALPKVAMLLGAEGPGLTDEALESADLRVRIPMPEGVDSLNIATAAAIAFHHFQPDPHTSESRQA